MDTPTTPPRGRTRRRPAIPGWMYAVHPALHLVVALSGPGYYLYATSQPVIGANMGAGFGLMWTAFWGLPWSMAPLNATGLSDHEELLAFTACALLNVAVLATVFLVLYRRARARGQTGRRAAPPPAAR